MPDIIQLLPDHVANQIAAGEVVQRPASVVKELLENAIDAGASEVKLIVKDSGKTLVQVVDNGKGMSQTDARMAFERHATSKIRSAEDLFMLTTKGFRGEALASIAAVAQVELQTRQEHDELGTLISIDGGTFAGQEVTTTARGTSIMVKNLFFNIPARRKFLKSDTVEFRHIMDEFHRVALAHPGIAFELYHNGSELFKLPAANTRQRIVHIFGGKTNEKLVPVEENTEVLVVRGFVGKPEFAKKTRGEQFFFVNDRFIKNSYLHHAVVSAFEGLMSDQSHPSYFLFLEVDPGQIDINIHPTKTEIKFEDEHSMYAIIRSAVKHSLGQFNVAPVLDFDRDANLDTPYEFQTREAKLPTVEVDSSFNPFRGESKTSFPSYERRSAEGWEQLYEGLQTRQDFADIELESEEVSGSLFEDQDHGAQESATYQLHRKYIVSTIKSGLVIIDQHRAHQRILYEDYLHRLSVEKGLSQQLLFPLELYLNPQEVHILQELRESLEFAGFVFGRIDQSGVVLEGIPVNLLEGEVQQVMEQLIADFHDGIPGVGYSQADALARSLARSTATRSGEVLSKAAQEALVHNLFATREPAISPFHKPTFITMSVEEIDKKFN